MNNEGEKLTKSYTDEEIETALRLYIEAGPEEACKVTGCSRSTLYRWLGSHSIPSELIEEKHLNARLETSHRLNQKRAALAEAFLDQSLTLSLAADPSLPLDAQRLMTAAAIASQKHLELTGGTMYGTGRPPEITMEWLELEIARLEGELPDRSAIDHELARTFGEWEQQRRHEIRTEIETELWKPNGADPSEADPPEPI